MVRVAAKRLRDDLVELRFHLVDGLPRREARPVGDAEHMRVDGEGLLTKSRVENDVRSLAPDPRQRLQLFARARHFRSILVDQCLAERDYVLGLGVEQADRLDRVPQRLLAKIHHLLWRLDAGEERSRRDIDAGVSSLGGEDDGDEQLIGIAGLELGRRRWVRLGEPPEELENFLALHRAPITSRME